MGAPPPPPIDSQGEANLRPPRSHVMMTLFACSRDPSNWVVAEAAWGSRDAHDQSTATRRPRPQAFGARGAPHLPFGFAAKPSPSVPWARRLLSAFWERGSPDLPACGLQRGSSRGPVRPVYINPSSRPSRGAKPRGADDARLPQERPHQAGSRGGGEPGPSWQAFPFSAAENLFAGAMGVATGNGKRDKKRAEQEEMGDGGSAPLPIYSKRRPTSAPHDHR